MTKHLDALTLSAWADGLLAPEDRQRAAAHLAECPACRTQAAEQTRIARLLMRLPPEALPPALIPNIVAAAAASAARRRLSEAAWRRLAVGSALAALAGLVLVVLALPDVARLVAALAGIGVPAASLTALLDLPADTLAGLASSTFDWASVLSGGAGVTLLTGLVLLTGGAFGGLAQLLRPEAVGAFN